MGGALISQTPSGRQAELKRQLQLQLVSLVSTSNSEETLTLQTLHTKSPASFTLAAHARLKGRAAPKQTRTEGALERAGDEKHPSIYPHAHRCVEPTCHVTSKCWILTLVQHDVSSLGDDRDPKI